MVETKNLRKTQWGKTPIFRGFDSVSQWSWDLVSLSGKYVSYLVFFVNRLILPFSSTTSVFGFMLLISIMLQLLSGFFLGWYYIPEPGLVIEMREEMFEETRYGAEVYYMHVRGVDVIFVLSYLHILKKIYLKNYITNDGDGWILGGYAFLWFHYIVVLGISLSANHLSDITLTITANIYWSLVNNIHKSYYFLFTNKHLNTDQLTRFMLLHYITPWYYLYLVKLHIMFCHEGWDSDSEKGTYEDKSTSWVTWFYDAFWKEIQDSWHIVICTYCYFYLHHFDIHSTAYHFFERWNIAELDEIRFYGVAPHWYFRPLMGLLTIAPTHFEGVMWLGLFFLFITFTPVIYNWYNTHHKDIAVIPTKDSFLQTFLFTLFMFSLFTTASMLPCGRYYYDPEGGYVGNTWLKWSYQYMYWYLGWLLYHVDHIDQFTYNYSKYLKYKVFGIKPVRKQRIRLYDWKKTMNGYPESIKKLWDGTDTTVVAV